MGLFVSIYELSMKPLNYGKSPTPLEWKNLSPEEMQSYMSYRKMLRDTHEAEITNLYRSLTTEQARKVVLEACAFYDDQGDPNHSFIVERTLQNIAINQPDALVGLYGLLLDRHLAWADGLIYRNADTATRDRMIAIVNANEDRSQWREDMVQGLAWIGDDIAQALFLHWRESPPVWESPLGPLSRFTWYAGWEFDHMEHRRELCFPSTFALVRPDEVVGSADSLVSVGGATAASCPWCHRQFTCVLDIQSPILQTLTTTDWHRLRIILCLNCSLQKSIFYDVDSQGNSSWSTMNGKQPHDLDLYPDEYVMIIPSLSLVLGKSHQPYLHIGAYWSNGLSQLGGFPEWVQNPAYPTCPMCHQTMLFISQISPRDITGDEGLIYAFACFECGKTTTNFQCT